LSLAHTKVSDAGLPHLAGLPVQFLWLNHTDVSDAGLVHCLNMRNLKLLHLRDCKVTNTGLGRIPEALLDEDVLAGLLGPDSHPPFPREDAWLNNMVDVPEEATVAIAQLKGAGVRVFLLDPDQLQNQEDGKAESEGGKVKKATEHESRTWV
jgi:hypothetical protein